MLCPVRHIRSVRPSYMFTERNRKTFTVMNIVHDSKRFPISFTSCHRACHGIMDRLGCTSYFCVGRIRGVEGDEMSWKERSCYHNTTRPMLYIVRIRYDFATRANILDVLVNDSPLCLNCFIVELFIFSK